MIIYGKNTVLEALKNKKKIIVICGPTASGKTEAAFLPILSSVINDSNKGCKVLYISPLKALINDQFLRLNDVLFNANIKVFRWHGDVNSYQKEKALNTNNIILQITKVEYPEELDTRFSKFSEYNISSINQVALCPRGSHTTAGDEHTAAVVDGSTVRHTTAGDKHGCRITRQNSTVRRASTGNVYISLLQRCPVRNTFRQDP